MCVTVLKQAHHLLYILVHSLYLNLFYFGYVTPGSHGPEAAAAFLTSGNTHVTLHAADIAAVEIVVVAVYIPLPREGCGTGH